MGNTSGSTRENRIVAENSDSSSENSIEVRLSIVNNNNRPNMSSLANHRPLTFHSVHGENVRLAKQGRCAKRYESFCKGLAFSSRPFEIDEIVVMKLSETATNWSGVLRFGVTNTDPQTLRSCLPKYACPDLTSKEGNWAKALTERFCQQANIIHFYVRPNGEMFYGINGVQKGLFLTGINCSLPMWVLLDIYGNSTAVEFLDPSEAPLLRQTSRPGANDRRLAPVGPNQAPPIPAALPSTTASTANTSAVDLPLSSSAAAAARRAAPSTSATTAPPGGTNPITAPPSARQTPISENEQALATAQFALELNQRLGGAASISQTIQPPKTSYPPIKHNAGVEIHPLEFHEICGKNIIISIDKCVATRNDNEYSNGYVFLKRPIRVNEKIIVQVMSVLPQYNGSLTFGVTSCDPLRIRPSALPEDADSLMDRPEYWIVNKDVANNPKELDELTFYLTDKGEIHFQRNNLPPRIIVHVDHTQRLWIFFDLFGTTQKIRLVGATEIVTPRPSIVPMTGNDFRRQGAQVPPPVSMQTNVPPLYFPASTFPQPTHPQQHQLRVQLPPPQAANQQRILTRPALMSTMPPLIVPQQSAIFTPPICASAGVTLDAATVGRRQRAPPPQPPMANFYQPPPPSAQQMQQQMRVTQSDMYFQQQRHMAIPPPPQYQSFPPPPPQQPMGVAPHNTNDLSQPPLVLTEPNQAMILNEYQQQQQSTSAPTGDLLTDKFGQMTVGQLGAGQGQLGAESTRRDQLSGGDSSRRETAGVAQNSSTSVPFEDDSSDECVVCMREKVDCVLYTCGHMCMCFKCAVTTWQKHGFCPLCRQPIKDVIKTYKAT